MKDITIAGSEALGIEVAEPTLDQLTAQADLESLRRGEGGVDLEPVLKNGAQVAMRRIGIKPATTAATLGAQNDDVIENIDGVALTSVENAYQAGGQALRKNESW